MPYYHVRITCETGNKREYAYETDLSEEEAKASVDRIVLHREKGQSIFFNGKWFKAEDVREIKVRETPQKITDNSTNGCFLLFNLPNIQDVTQKFTKSPLKIGGSKSERDTKPLSKDIFIVHGTDHKPMKELKTLLRDLGLNPIVLHEQPSGGATIIEKLEKHSDVSFAFVILTPDDGLFNFYRLVSLTEGIISRRLGKVEEDKVFFDEFLKIVKKVARQNVILEFGYFVGLLGRHRVCCLGTGDVDMPADMLGIVYVPFKESVNEAREMILKELKEAGYEIKA